jgi:hypothetical protein
MHVKKSLTAVLVIGLAILVSACNVLGPKAPPSSDPSVFQNTLNAAATEAIQTISAQFTQTFEAIPTEAFVPIASATTDLVSIPTNTEVPPTPTQGPPTWTPIPTLPPTFTPTVTLAASLTPTATKGPLHCEVISQSPTRGQRVNYGSDIDWSVKFKNTGTKDWAAANVDFKYLSGEKMHKYADSVDLTKDVKVNEEFTFVIDVLAPSNAGIYRATWNLMEGSTIICSATIEIEVTR